MKWLKKLFAILIISFSILNINSINTNASGVSIPVQAQWSSNIWLNGANYNSVNCSADFSESGGWIAGQIRQGTNDCSISAFNIRARNVISSNGWAVSPNDYLEYTFAIYQTSDNDYGDGYFSKVNGISTDTGGVGLTIVDINFQQATNSTGIIKIIAKPNSVGTLFGTTYFGEVDLGLKNGDVFKPIRLTKWNVILPSGGGSVDTQSIVNAISNTKQTVDTILVEVRWGNQLLDDQNTILNQILTQEINASNAQEEMNDKDNEDRENLENQKEENQEEAETQKTDAENTGSTLFEAFGQFINSLRDIHGNNCMLPDININGMILENLDLCTIEVPPAIIGLVGIGMVFIIVPLGIHLVKKMISLYKEILG